MFLDVTGIEELTQIPGIEEPTQVPGIEEPSQEPGIEEHFPNTLFSQGEKFLYKRESSYLVPRGFEL